MSTPGGSQPGHGPQPNTQFMPIPASVPPQLVSQMPLQMFPQIPPQFSMNGLPHHYSQSPPQLPFPPQAGAPGTRFPPSHPIEGPQPQALQPQVPQQQGTSNQGSQPAPPPHPAGLSWTSVEVIQRALMPNDPPGLAVTMGPELPFPFTLAYLELALEFHLDHPGGESPLFMLFDMMDVVGSAPAQNTQEFRKYMLNKLSYWIPFTKFVAEREIKDMNDIGKLVGVVKMLTAHNMLDPNFVYRCFGYAIYQCGKIDRTGLMVNRLHRMMFHLQANGLIEKGNYTPPDPRAHPPRGS